MEFLRPQIIKNRPVAAILNFSKNNLRISILLGMLFEMFNNFLLLAF